MSYYKSSNSASKNQQASTYTSNSTAVKKSGCGCGNKVKRTY